MEQLPCFISHTTSETHRIVRDNIGLSPLYSGVITGVSARYCPSLEDKVMRFTDKPSHQVTLEREGRDTEEIYAKGLGNCLPVAIQLRLFRSVPGLEEVEVMRPAYAIEYDFVDPTELKPTLETKRIAGLYMAGQINGTFGLRGGRGPGPLGRGQRCLRRDRPPALPAGPLPGLHGRAGGRSGHQGHPGALPPVHLPGRIPPAPPGGQRRPAPHGMGP